MLLTPIDHEVQSGSRGQTNDSRVANNFDALRLFAACGVIWSHAYPAMLGSNELEPLNVLSAGQLTVGELCVAVFFVISGWLITQSALRTPSITQFLAYRLTRLVPALFIVTFIMAVIVGPLVSTASAQLYWSDRLTYRYFGNVLLYPLALRLPGVFEVLPYPQVTNASIWTLCYEFTCYLVVAQIALLYRHRWLLATVLMVVLVFSIFATYIVPRTFFDLFQYFGSGAAFYLLRRHFRFERWLFVLCLLGLLATLLLGQGFLAMFCVAGAYATLYLSLVPRLSFPLNGHADLSYGVYLYGWPAQQALVPYSSGPTANFVAALFVALVFATFSWVLVERPALSNRKRIARQAQTAVAVLVKKLRIDAVARRIEARRRKEVTR